MVIVISDERAIAVARELGISVKSIRRLLGGTSDSAFHVKNYWNHSLFLKLTDSSNESAADKLRQEIHHLYAGRRLVAKAGVKNIVVPQVHSRVDSTAQSCFGFLAEWLPGKNLGDSMTGTRPSESVDVIKNLLSDLKTVWSMGVETNADANREFAYKAYLIRPREALANAARLTRGHMFNALDDSTLVVNGRELRNPIGLLQDMSDQVFAAVQLRPCLSGDLTALNLMSMPGGRAGIYDPRGYCPSIEVDGLETPALDPAYDLAKLLFSGTGWLDFVRGGIKVSEPTDSNFELEFLDKARSPYDVLTQEIVSSFDTAVPDVDKESFGTLVLVALATHYLTEPYHRLKNGSYSTGNSVVAPYLMGAMLLDEVAKGLERGSVDALKCLEPLRLEGASLPLPIPFASRMGIPTIERPPDAVRISSDGPDPRLVDAVRSGTGLVGVDFDGVISEIERDPRRARPLPEVLTVMSELAAVTPVLIPTGRSVSFVRSRIPDPCIHISGLYGRQWTSPSGNVVTHPVAEADRHKLRKARDLVRAAMHDEDLLRGGVWIEDKDGLTFAVHIRPLLHERNRWRQRERSGFSGASERVYELDQLCRRLDARVPAIVQDVARSLGLESTSKSEVSEVHSPGFDKFGSVLESYYRLSGATHGVDVVSYFGDEKRDLRAFDALEYLAENEGVSIVRGAVGSSCPELVRRADVVLEDPRHVAEYLNGVLGAARAKAHEISPHVADLAPPLPA